MSEVIGFRLNKENPREARALLVLDGWRTKGYSIRQTITEALLRLDKTVQKPEGALLDEMNETLRQVNHLLRQIENGNSLPTKKSLESPTTDDLSASFVASVRKSAKSGVKLC
jgi:hypothetical protein